MGPLAAHRSAVYVANASVIRSASRTCTARRTFRFSSPPHFGGHHRTGWASIPGLEEFTESDDYFLIVSRLLPYKNVDKAVEACNELGKKLLVIGRGPEKERLEALAGPTVRIASGVSDAQLRYAYRHCLALLAISYEGLRYYSAGSGR